MFSLALAVSRKICTLKHVSTELRIRRFRYFEAFFLTLWTNFARAKHFDWPLCFRRQSLL